MPAPTRPLLIRTAHFLDKLRVETGLGAQTLYERIAENQYRRHNLPPPSFETVRDLFRLRASPGINPQPTNDIPWLFAAELEFPGSAYNFFHPVFDLLFGHLESGWKWDQRVSKIPPQWINQAIADQRHDLAEKWRKVNEDLSTRGPRKKAQPTPPLHTVRMTLLRLAPRFRALLFRKIWQTGMISRRLGDPRHEVAACAEVPSMDALAALMVLLMEASELTDWDRFHVVRRALRAIVPTVAQLPECRRLVDTLPSLLRTYLVRMPAPVENPEGVFYFAKASSWAGHLAPTISHHFEELYGHSPNDV